MTNPTDPHNVHVGGSDSNDAQPNPPVDPPVVPTAGGVPDAPANEPPVSALHVDAPPGGWHSVAPDAGPQVYEPAWPGDRQTQQTIGPVGSIHGDPSAVDPFRQALTKDCQEAAMVPVIQRATGEQVTDQALADQASRLASATPTGHPPMFTPMFDPVTGTNDTNAQALLAVHGVPSTWLVPNNEADYLTQLERDLDAGYPVMVGVNEARLQNHAGYDSHEVLVTGVDDANNLIYYFDPWIGANTSAPVSVFTEACDHSMISTNPDRLPHVTLPTWPDDPPGDLGLPNPTDTDTTEFIDGTDTTDTDTDTDTTEFIDGTDTTDTDTDTDTTGFIDGTDTTDTDTDTTGFIDGTDTDTDTTGFIDGTDTTDTTPIRPGLSTGPTRPTPTDDRHRHGPTPTPTPTRPGLSTAPTRPTPTPIRPGLSTGPTPTPIRPGLSTGPTRPTPTPIRPGLSTGPTRPTPTPIRPGLSTGPTRPTPTPIRPGLSTGPARPTPTRPTPAPALQDLSPG